MFQVTSAAFQNGGHLPERFASVRGGGQDVSPPLEWSQPPEGTRALLVVVIDRHPVAHEFMHWVVTDLPPDTTSLPEGASGRLPAGRELAGTSGDAGYHGPTPPPGTGEHEYEMIVYALDERPALPDQPSIDDVERAVDGHVLVSASVSGMLGR